MCIRDRSFTIEAITVDLGFEGVSMEPIQKLCDELGIHYTPIPTEIYKIIFEDRKESNPCSLCSKMRKGALNEVAKELGCNKVAYGHHKDDVVETMLMSLIYEGRFHTFSPVTYWDRMGLTLIRPLLFMEEKDVIGFQNKYDLPVVKNKCPADGNTKREYIKNLLHQLNQDKMCIRDSPPPIIMATITIKLERPVESPSIFGPRIFPSNCCRTRMNSAK